MQFTPPSRTALSFLFMGCISSFSFPHYSVFWVLSKMLFETLLYSHSSFYTKFFCYSSFYNCTTCFFFLSLQQEVQLLLSRGFCIFVVGGFKWNLRHYQVLSTEVTLECFVRHLLGQSSGVDCGCPKVLQFLHGCCLGPGPPHPASGHPVCPGSSAAGGSLCTYCSRGFARTAVSTHSCQNKKKEHVYCCTCGYLSMRFTLHFLVSSSQSL